MTLHSAVADRESTELCAALGRCELASFSHQDHVRVAWALLGQNGFADTVARLPKLLRKYATSKNVPECYHETITIAFIALIHERLHSSRSNSWTEFTNANHDLLEKNFLSRYYEPEMLASSLSRRVFLLQPRDR